MAQSKDDLIAMREKLVAAKATGLRRIKTGEDEIEYRTDAELAAAIADLDRLIAAFQETRHWLNKAIPVTSTKGI